MIDFPHKIPIGQLGRESRLYMDYVSGADSAIQAVLGGYGRSRPVWEESLERTVATEGNGRRELVEQLVSYNGALGACDDILDKLMRFGRGEARIVVTGQQPGVLGGALLTLHKICTAVSLAEHIERTYGTPCFPLFWMGADDADFQEIRELFLVDCDLSPLVTAIDNSAWVTASPVGALPVESVERVWKAVAPIVAKCPFGALVSEMVLAALDGAKDHGEASAKILSALAGGRIAVVDGREPLLRTAARELYLRYFDDETRVRELITSGGEELEAHGYHAQLKQGPDSGVFLVEDGRRKKIGTDHRGEARERMAADITAFSPGVALRNLVQDHVFQPVAAVLGPAEISYRAQLDGLYDWMEVHKPVAFPRMPGTWLSPQVARLVDSIESPDIVQLLTDTGAFVKKVYESESVSDGEDAAARFRRIFAAESKEFLSAIAETADDRTTRRARKRLEDVSRRLDRALEVAEEAGKNAALSHWPFLEGLEQFLSRNAKPQDRYLSCLAPCLFTGEAAVAGLGAAADTFVDGALDGRTPHVLYCG